MEEQNIPKSIDFLQTELDKLVDGQFPLRYADYYQKFKVLL